MILERLAVKAALKALPWKAIGIGAAALVLIVVGWLAWCWIDGMRDTIAAQAKTITAKDQEIGGLREANRTIAAAANHNARELAAEQARGQALLDRLAQNRRDHQRRESQLEEALNEIDKWKPDQNGSIGSGLRGVLGGLRGQGAAGGTAGGDEGTGGVRHGP